MNPVKNIFFDLDGTLSKSQRRNSEKSLSCFETSSTPCFGEKTDFGWVIGPPLQETVAKILGNNHVELIQRGNWLLSKTGMQKRVSLKIFFTPALWKPCEFCKNAVICLLQHPNLMFLRSRSANTFR